MGVEAAGVAGGERQEARQAGGRQGPRHVPLVVMVMFHTRSFPYSQPLPKTRSSPPHIYTPGNNSSLGLNPHTVTLYMLKFPLVCTAADKVRPYNSYRADLSQENVHISVWLKMVIPSKCRTLGIYVWDGVNNPADRVANPSSTTQF